MADLDAELLALAGGDSSSEEETTSKARAKSESRAPSPTSTVPTQQREGKAGVARKKTTKVPGGSKRAPKRPRRQDSEEEGEASSAPATPNSLDSASMSESESDTSPAADAEDDGLLFPYEGIYYSEQDKAEIMAMPEIQRESILAERDQLKEQRIQRATLRRLLKERKWDNSGAGGQKKRKAADTDMDEKQRKSSRQKTTLGGRKVGESSDAMEAYKRQREQKGQRDEQRKKGDERKDKAQRGEEADKYSDADAEGESEVEWDDPKATAARRSISAPRDDSPADIKDYDHVRVGRDNFAMVCFYPGFEQAITGCFTRINLGPDKATGQDVYRMAQIKGFTQGKAYALEGVNGKPFATDQYATVAIGKSEMAWPFLACSNQPFTEVEFGRWKRTLAAENVTPPTKSFLMTKLGHIHNLINHRFTDEEIQEKLRRSGVLKNKFASLERNRIEARRKDAVKQSDEAAIAKCDAELTALEGPKLAFGTSLQPRPAGKAPGTSTGISQQDRLAEINRRNRRANQQEVRRAQQAERKAEQAYQAAVERGEAVANPFARVKTRAKVHYDVKADLLAPPQPARSASQGLDELFDGGNSDRSRAGTPGGAASGTNTPLNRVANGTGNGTLKPTTSGLSRSATPSLLPTNGNANANASANGEKKKPSWATRSQPLTDDEVLASLDIQLDPDLGLEY